MAWQVGPFSMREGSSLRIALWWDNDPGVQTIQALPFQESGRTVGTTSALAITDVQIENEPGRGRIGPYNTRTTYFITIVSRRPFNNSSFFTADPVTFFIRGGKV